VVRDRSLLTFQSGGQGGRCRAWFAPAGAAPRRRSRRCPVGLLAPKRLGFQVVLQRRHRAQGDVRGLLVPEGSAHPLRPIVRRLPLRRAEELTELGEACRVHLLLDAPEGGHRLQRRIRPPALPVRRGILQIPPLTILVPPDRIPGDQEVAGDLERRAERARQQGVEARLLVCGEVIGSFEQQKATVAQGRTGLPYRRPLAPGAGRPRRGGQGACWHRGHRIPASHWQCAFERARVRGDRG